MSTDAIELMLADLRWTRKLAATLHYVYTYSLAGLAVGHADIVFRDSGRQIYSGRRCRGPARRAPGVRYAIARGMAVCPPAVYNVQVPKGSANVKGSIVRSRIDVLRTKGLFDAVMALLPEADRSVWTGLVLPTSWYSFEMSQRLDVATAKVLGRGDARKAYLELGRASADANLSGVHKAYVRAGNPHHLLSCAPQIYKQYYDKGYRTYEKLSPTNGVLKTFEAENVTANDCLTVIGWHERAIELCGGAGVRVKEINCRARGDDLCEYVCSWRI